MTDSFIDHPFLDDMGDDEDYEFFSILQEYDEQFANNLLPQQQISQQPKPLPPLQQPNTLISHKKERTLNKNDVKLKEQPKLVNVKHVFSKPQEKKFAEIFEFENFNPLQSRCFNTLYNGNTNIVVSGKRKLSF